MDLHYEAVHRFTELGISCLLRGKEGLCVMTTITMHLWLGSEYNAQDGLLRMLSAQGEIQNSRISYPESEPYLPQLRNILGCMRNKVEARKRQRASWLD